MSPCDFKDVPIGALCGNEENRPYWRKLSNNTYDNVESVVGNGSYGAGRKSHYYRTSRVYWVLDEDVIP